MRNISNFIILTASIISSITLFPTYSLASDKPKELEFIYLPCADNCNKEDPARAQRGYEKFVVKQTLTLEKIAKKKDPLGQIRSNKARSRSTWMGGGGNPASMR